MASELYLLRHGETEWTLSGRHTGITEIPLTAHGEEEARQSGTRLQAIGFSRNKNACQLSKLRSTKLRRIIMKRLTIVCAFIFAAGFTSAETLKVNPAASKIEWVGKKVTGQHNGTVAIKSGELMVEKKQLTGGQFAIDMTSIKDLDLKDDSNAKLTGHLKSDDFFGVEKYPESTFKITGVKEGQVTGDLTIKDKTNSLTFPAKITVAKGKVTAIAKDVKVDRTLYDVRYGSGKFFENLGDKVIYDDFTLDIMIVATN